MICVKCCPFRKGAAFLLILSVLKSYGLSPACFSCLLPCFLSLLTSLLAFRPAQLDHERDKAEKASKILNLAKFDAFCRAFSQCPPPRSWERASKFPNLTKFDAFCPNFSKHPPPRSWERTSKIPNLAKFDAFGRAFSKCPPPRSWERASKMPQRTIIDAYRLALGLF
jgi:hypothetical protein